MEVLNIATDSMFHFLYANVPNVDVVSVIGNVYGPHGDEGKAVFFAELVTSLEMHQWEWFWGGNFNVVLRDEERRGCRIVSHDSVLFQCFIADACLHDFPLLQGEFT